MDYDLLEKLEKYQSGSLLYLTKGPSAEEHKAHPCRNGKK